MNKREEEEKMSLFWWSYPGKVQEKEKAKLKEKVESAN